MPNRPLEEFDLNEVKNEVNCKNIDNLEQANDNNSEEDAKIPCKRRIWRAVLKYLKEAWTGVISGTGDFEISRAFLISISL